jgi:hypothetical protein
LLRRNLCGNGPSKRSIQFDFIKRILSKVADAGIARTEIIQCYFDAMRLQRSYYRFGASWIFYQYRFRELYFKTSKVEATAFGNSLNLADQIPVVEL